MTDAVSLHVQGPVLTAQLRRPARGNALDDALVDGLMAALAAAAMPDIRLLVLQGEGRNFCTGFDLAGLETQSDGDLLRRFVRIELLLQAIHHAPVPCLALAQGRVFGAGADIFAACRWRVATPSTSFAFPGARFGLVLGTRRLAMVAGAQAALDLTQLGRTLDAPAALRCGLATDMVEEAAFAATVAAYAAELAATPRETVSALRDAALPDNRAQDLAALVHSAAAPGLGARIAAYAAQRAKAKPS